MNIFIHRPVHLVSARELRNNSLVLCEGTEAGGPYRYEVSYLRDYKVLLIGSKISTCARDLGGQIGVLG